MEGTPQTPLLTDVARRRGPFRQALLHEPRAARVRHRRVGAARRAHRPRRPRRLRAARRRVPEDVDAERDEHRRPEVLPRPARQPTREHSVKQMIGRVAGTIADWGRSRGYFASVEDGDTFEAELAYILLHQMAAFNSPVWFNVGFEESPQCSACMPYGALISTPDGMVQIGELVDGDQVGREVYDAHGVTRIVATKANGIKPVYRVRLRNGSFVEATADHVVKAVRERRTAAAVAARRRARGRDADAPAPAPREGRVERALVAAGGGSAFADDAAAGRRGQGLRGGARRLAAGRRLRRPVRPRRPNRSLTIEFLVANDEERAWVEQHLDVVLPRRAPQGARRRHARGARCSASASTARCSATSSSAGTCSRAGPR